MAAPVAVLTTLGEKFVISAAFVPEVHGKSASMGAVIFDGFSHQLPDNDPEETSEWLESFDSVVAGHGKARAQYLLMRLLERARNEQVDFPATVSTPYINTIPPENEPDFPGDEEMERRIRAYIRWNAAAMVVRANALSEGIGGHLSTYASSASLYEVGFNHFFRGKDAPGGGDQIYFQGHASPGIYARAFLEGRLDEDQLDHFRREVSGNGLSSYPHPRLMADFWEFPTVSMGLGPINAIYQARFNRYLANRGIVDTSASKVWCFVGDGETDEPETLGALSLAARERLDNLIFVVNCNLQRLDGPVRGNGKIIQELETVFRGAGWNVIKVVWGSRWDELLAKDIDGVLLNKMMDTVDGEYQRLATESGAYIRENFFGPDPRLQALVAHLTDEELRMLPRGGHDYRKMFAAYKAAVENEGSPSVILAKTIKGWTLGPEIESRNSTHQIKKMNKEQMRVLRDRLQLQNDIPDALFDQSEYPPYFRPAPGSDIHNYLMERRNQLGGSLPRRSTNFSPIAPVDRSAFAELETGSGTQSVSTTMAFARLLRGLLRDGNIGKRVVPIIPDEGRTFGMEALFKEVKIYAAFGQRYKPVDAELMLSYAESQEGQILEEGITEAGSMSSFTAAGTSYATWGETMIPFFTFYSMFGFQRVGDLAWAFGDMRGRGFLMGATAGRTTLNGEGLQHEDGHSHVLASTFPNLSAYDPAFAYELATVVEDGIRRMYTEGEDRFYYITIYNENYPMPAKPEDVDEGIIRGIYKFGDTPVGPRRKATILFSGTSWQEAMRAQQLLAEHHDVGAACYSVTSYKALREDALETERHNRLHPEELARLPYITDVLFGANGPYVAVTDYMKLVPDQIARWVPGHYTVLGTDGYGRSDTREALRRHFETDAEHIVVGVMQGLVATGDGKPEEVADAITRYGLDPDSINPLHA